MGQVSRVRGQGCPVQKRYIFSALSSLLPVFCLVSVAVAAGGGEGGHHKSLFDTYFWPLVNFAVLIAVLAYMLTKMDIKGYFRKRTELIEQTLKEAREAKELAQKALAEVEERLRVKDKEIEDIVSYARQSGEKEKAFLIEEGEKMKLKILEQAKTNIDFELKRAKEEIKAEAVDVAMDLAEKKLRSKLTKDEQLKLLEESLAKIEERS